MADRESVDCGEYEYAVRDAVRAAVSGETAAISRLPVQLQAEAQQRATARLVAARRAELQAQRANPLHADPL